MSAFTETAATTTTTTAAEQTTNPAYSWRPKVPEKCSPFRQMELDGEIPLEPLLADNPNRFVLFPIQHPKIWDMYKKAEASFWTAEELDLAHDAKDWEKMSANEKHFISHVLAFFAARYMQFCAVICFPFVLVCARSPLTNTPVNLSS